MACLSGLWSFTLLTFLTLCCWQSRGLFLLFGFPLHSWSLALVSLCCSGPLVQVLTLSSSWGSCPFPPDAQPSCERDTASIDSYCLLILSAHTLFRRAYNMTTSVIFFSSLKCLFHMISLPRFFFLYKQQNTDQALYKYPEKWLVCGAQNKRRLCNWYKLPCKLLYPLATRFNRSIQ